MAMIRTANPALGSKTFKDYAGTATGSRTMTVQGVVNRTGFLLVLLVLAAAWVWNEFATAPEGQQMAAVMPYVVGGALGGFVVALITIFAKKIAFITAPVYAVLEGLFLGGLSAIFEAQYPGIVIQAVGLTFGTAFCLLVAYTTGLIKATENFKLGVFAATGGIAVVYLVSFVLGFFGRGIPLIHSSGPWGIAFSVFVVIVAALNLVLDFDFIETGAEQGVPKYLEWTAAFGLIVTLVWLYIELLRLLSKLRSR